MDRRGRRTAPGIEPETGAPKAGPGTHDANLYRGFGFLGRRGRRTAPGIEPGTGAPKAGPGTHEAILVVVWGGPWVVLRFCWPCCWPRAYKKERSFLRIISIKSQKKKKVFAFGVFFLAFRVFLAPKGP